MANLKPFSPQIPKAELHLHLEAAITPDLARTLANRHQITLPVDLIEAESTFTFKDFPDFLRQYDVVANLVRSPEDFYEITYDYLARSAREGVIYSELMISPDHGRANGVTYPDLLKGVKSGAEDAKRDFGIEARLIAVLVRHLGPSRTEETMREILKNADPYVVGVNLAGDEVHYPPQLFASAFEMAKQAGLGCSAHAGEAVGPEGVWEALNHLPITRLGHGVRSIEDPNLVSFIREKGIVLEVCPTSNIALGVYSDFKTHPFLQLLQAGLILTLNSDDPSFFGSTIGQEYAHAKLHFGLSDDQLIELTRNSLQHSFAEKPLKEALLKKLSMWNVDSARLSSARGLSA